MKLALVTLPVAAAFALVVAAGCSAPDPGAGIGSYRSHGGSTSTGANGGGTASGAGGANGGTSSTPGPSGTGVPDAPGSDAGTKGGGGTGGGADAGTTSDSGGPSTAKLGSCLNPVCGTDGVQCGCHATDSAGNTVEVGCQGGQCVCVVNGAVDGNPTDAPNACDSQSNVKDAFLAGCACN